MSKNALWKKRELITGGLNATIRITIEYVHLCELKKYKCKKIRKTTERREICWTDDQRTRQDYRNG